METKINIADILKDKPKGTKLYSSACGKCNLEEVYDKSFKISFYNSKFGFMNGGEGHLDKNGKLYDDGECVVFPSKEMRDWSKFAWKKGDVLVNKDRDAHIVFEKFTDDTYTTFTGRHYYMNDGENKDAARACCNVSTECYTLETEDVAQSYINDLEKRWGGKLNHNTLEIEKRPEFKDGDILCITDESESCKYISIYKKQEGNHINRYATMFEDKNIKITAGGFLLDNENLSKRYATDSEKQQLFDALAKKGKAWDAEKKQIVDLKPKWTPKPFDRVITRLSDDSIWTANIFSHIDRHGKYVTIGCISGYHHCIPYNEETVKLIGTTDEWKGDN